MYEQMKEAASGLEQKFCRFDEDLTVQADGLTIEGYASRFGACDQGGDIVQAGAYKSSLARLMAEGRRVKMLWQHDPAQPIGIWDEIREDATGLWVKGRLLEGVARGREAAELIRAGAIDGLSIGYRTKRSAKDDGGRRLLTELELWEVSLVTFPMLPSARVAAKGFDPLEEPLRELAAALRAAGAELGGR
ncbi:HK97 family phage prohead protease [Pseudooceanicola endophyticus]|nr:HK97 family phage prohead protease [Pseudooceanicola endophyticus]